MAQVAYPHLGVYFVSREPVRSPAPLVAFARVRAALEEKLPGVKLAGSLSASTQNRFAIAACPGGLGRAPESALCEVYEYDAVRYQAMVIGLVEPPPETPVHWIARRVNPKATLVAVLPSPPPLSFSVKVQPAVRGYLGDTNTLLALGKILKGSATAAVEGVGLVAVADDAPALARSIAAAASKAPAKKPKPRAGRKP